MESMSQNQWGQIMFLKGRILTWPEQICLKFEIEGQIFWSN